MVRSSNVSAQRRSKILSAVAPSTGSIRYRCSASSVSSDSGSLAAAAFLGAGAVPFVRQEPLQRHNEEGAEAALLPRGRFQVILLQQPGEELLGQVLGVGRAVPLPAHVGIQGIPVGAAKRFERRGGLRRILPARRQDHRPVRGNKDRRAPAHFRRGRRPRMSGPCLGCAHRQDSRLNEPRGKTLAEECGTKRAGLERLETRLRERVIAGSTKPQRACVASTTRGDLHQGLRLVIYFQMKATLPKPEIVVRDGKPVSVILRLKDYQELLERAEDAEDTAWLTKAREKPRHYRPLEEYLAERNAKRRV